MKHKIFLSLVAVLLTALSAQSYDFKSGDLYYNTTSGTTVEVTYQSGSTNYQGLTTATIPETVTYDGTTYSVTSIGESAFDGCSSLTSITIPNSVMSIEDLAFLDCFSLTSVTIPNSVTRIGEGAFWGCSSLTSIVVESGNTMYDSRENCNAIIETASNTLIAGCQSTTFPNSVTSIGDGAFTGCSSLTSVTIPNSVTSIEDYAFHYCSSLTSITIPNSITSIGEYAFSSCSSLTSVTIPHSVTSIGEDAFQGCSSLTSVTIPNSVTSIGEDAFQACSSIADIYCYATTPPVCDDDNTFSGVSKRCYVHVPAGTITNYQVATGWRYFSKFLEISEETSISETEQQNKSSRKIIRDGQVLILRNGVTYDIMGNRRASL